MPAKSQQDNNLGMSNICLFQHILITNNKLLLIVISFIISSWFLTRHWVGKSVLVLSFHHPTIPTSLPLNSSGPWAQCPVGLPVNHPERCCYEAIGPAADPHERHSGLSEVLQLLQPLPRHQHTWQDFPSGGQRSFSSCLWISRIRWR